MLEICVITNYDGKLKLISNLNRNSRGYIRTDLFEKKNRTDRAQAENFNLSIFLSQLKNGETKMTALPNQINQDIKTEADRLWNAIADHNVSFVIRILGQFNDNPQKVKRIHYLILKVEFPNTLKESERPRVIFFDNPSPGIRGIHSMKRSLPHSTIVTFYGNSHNRKINSDRMLSCVISSGNT